MSARSTAARLLVPAALVAGTAVAGTAVAGAAFAGITGSTLDAVAAGTATVRATGEAISLGTDIRPGDVVSLRRLHGAVPDLRTPGAAVHDTSGTVRGLEVRTVSPEELSAQLSPTLQDARQLRPVQTSTSGGTSVTVRPTVPRTPDAGRLAQTVTSGTSVSSTGAGTQRTRNAVRQDARSAVSAVSAEQADVTSLQPGTGAGWTGTPGSGSVQALRDGEAVSLQAQVPAQPSSGPSRTDVSWELPH